MTKASVSRLKKVLPVCRLKWDPTTPAALKATCESEESNAMTSIHSARSCLGMTMTWPAFLLDSA